MPIILAHRGNTDGPQPATENTVSAVQRALTAGWRCRDRYPRRPRRAFLHLTRFKILGRRVSRRRRPPPPAYASRRHGGNSVKELGYEAKFVHYLDGWGARVLKAGADRVVNPYHLGGTRLAHLVTKPAIVSFFDASLSGVDELRLDQTSLRAGSAIAGQTLREADLRQRWGLGVVAVQRAKQVIPNPASDFRFQDGDILVVFGSRRRFSRSKRSAAGCRRDDLVRMIFAASALRTIRPAPSRGT